MGSASKHWGEFDTDFPINQCIPDVTADIEKSMDKHCLMEYEDDSDKEQTENVVSPPIDPLVSYAISLHKYTNDMTEMIRVVELATELNLIPPDVPPLPKMPEVKIKHKLNSLNFIPKEITDFCKGKEVEVQELNEVIVKKLLTKCVVTLFAHAGYETTHQSVLDVMTDVLEDFMIKFCGKITQEIMENENGDVSKFTNIIEKVLLETGFGGAKGLHEYYQKRVIKYLNILKKRCKDLNDHYKELIDPKINPSIKYEKVKIKEEIDNKEDEEIHFALDPSLLESNLELLNATEAEGSLETIEIKQEDILPKDFIPTPQLRKRKETPKKI